MNMMTVDPPDTESEAKKVAKVEEASAKKPEAESGGETTAVAQKTQLHICNSGETKEMRMKERLLKRKLLLLRKKKEEMETDKTFRTNWFKSKLEQKQKKLKRVKMSVESSLMEYVCPISHELPLDPVMAMDGGIYERSEIEKWIEMKGRSVTSPLTNKTMGQTLISAQRVYNAIEQLIEESSKSELAKSWLGRINQRKVDKKEVAKLQAKAEAGNPEAMYELGILYEEGRKGIIKDEDQAFQWFKKSSELHDPPGMFKYASYFLWPQENVTKNLQFGTCLVGMAAAKGSQLACYTLGEWFRDGEFGFPEDLNQTRHYFYKVVNGSCEHVELDDADVQKAQKWLDDHAAFIFF